MAVAETNVLDIEQIPIIDTDTHVSETADLWTSRLPKKWGELIPRVEQDDSGMEWWRIRDHRIVAAGVWAAAGWDEYPPKHPKRMSESDPASFDPEFRLERMDEFGLYAQVLYPNLLAFYLPTFLSLGNQEFVLDCIRAYNDFLAEFAAVDRDRLIPLMVLPYWDMKLAVQEMERCIGLGHRGIVFGSNFAKIDLPPVWDMFYDPIFSAAQDAEMSINFHVGFSELSEDDMKKRVAPTLDAAEHIRISSPAQMRNSQAIADIITKGVCHRYPKLNFVSVESGVGWLPYLIESLDWNWVNWGARTAEPHMEMPSVYFKRQIYGSFWFERESMARVADILADNIMFETDFPHPTSLSPGPASSVTEAPRLQVARALANVSLEDASKILYENAAKLYKVPDPR